jgi:hypothetical protein
MGYRDQLAAYTARVEQGRRRCSAGGNSQNRDGRPTANQRQCVCQRPARRRSPAHRPATNRPPATPSAEWQAQAPGSASSVARKEPQRPSSPNDKDERAGVITVGPHGVKYMFTCRGRDVSQTTVSIDEVNGCVVLVDPIVGIIRAIQNCVHSARSPDGRRDPSEHRRRRGFGVASIS